MPKSRPLYPPELKHRMVELVRAGRTPEELSREFESSAQAIHNWVKQTDLDKGKEYPLPSTPKTFIEIHPFMLHVAPFFERFTPEQPFEQVTDWYIPFRR